MKRTGIVRALDELGQIVIPKEIRRILNIKEKDGIEVYMEEDSIILKKYEPGCIFCGTVKDDAIGFRGKYVCQICAEDLKGKAWYR